mgnify:CR=1 FL=1
MVDFLEINKNVAFVAKMLIVKSTLQAMASMMANMLVYLGKNSNSTAGITITRHQITSGK